MSMMPTDRDLRLRSGYRLQWEDAQQAYVLLFPEGMVTLNDSAAEILRYCDGTRGAHAVAAALAERFGEEVREDVHEFLQIAWDKGWLDAG